jgi:hypothetical protein
MSFAAGRPSINSVRGSLSTGCEYAPCSRLEFSFGLRQLEGLKNFLIWAYYRGQTCVGSHFKCGYRQQAHEGDLGDS